MLVCRRVPDVPSSSVAVPKADADSPRRGRPYRPLRGHGVFTRVYRTGRRVRRGNVITVTSPEGSGLPQVGFVAGRRVGNAVERNRAKRRLREAMARVPLQRDASYVVIADVGVNDVEFGQLVGWLRDAVLAGQPTLHEEDE